MTRLERRRYRRAKRAGQLSRTMLLMAVVVIAAGLAGRLRDGGLTVERLPAATVTPVAAAFDETLTEREITLPAETWYAIQTGVYAAESSAKERAAAYTDRGAPGVVIEDGGKYRVFIAAFGSQNDAASVRDRLGSRQEVETYLYAWTCPEITLRMNGMAGQLDVAEAGLDMALRAAAAVRDAVTAYDQGGITADDLLDALAGQEDRFSVWAETAAARFDRPYPPLIADELALSDAWHTACQEIRSAGRESATAMSAAAKCQCMLMFSRVAAMRTGISDS